MVEDVDDLPSHSPAGKAALDIFYVDFNDVSFYVEDEEQENLYEIILRKLLPELRICRVFALGGKPAVLKHASDKMNERVIGKKIYLIDKDFDDLLGTYVVDRRIFYLDRFCIENYMCEEEAIIEVITETLPKKKRAQTKTELNLNTVILDCLQALKPLFLLFFCVQKFDLGIKNCNSKPEEYCHAKHLWQLKSDSVDKYKAEVIKIAASKQLHPALLDPLSESRTETIRKAPNHSVVSGKFLLAMVFHYIKSKVSLGSITFESFTYRVAKNSSLDSLQPVAAQIRASLC